jgi:hypothetical protein
MSRMPFRGAGPVGPSAGVHHWAALPSGVKVSDDEVNTAERGPSHANHQNENVPGTHTRPFRSQIGRTSVPRIVGGVSSTRNQSSDECGRLILGYCTRGLSVITPPAENSNLIRNCLIRGTNFEYPLELPKSYPPKCGLRKNTVRGAQRR